MEFRKLITENYTQIKEEVYFKSFKYKVDNRDLLSLVNERISVGLLTKNIDVEFEGMFWNYMRKVVTCCALDLIRRAVPFDPMEDRVVGEPAQIETILSARALINEVYNSIPHSHHKAVFMSCLVNGAKYEEAAKDLGINVQSIKTIIFQIRKKAMAKHKETYLEIINN